MLDLPPPDPSIEIVISSRGMSQGTAQTKGVQLVSRAAVKIGDVQVGGQWKNLSSPVADGVAMVFTAVTHKQGRVHATLSAAYKFQTNVHRKTDSDGFELSGVIDYRSGPFGLRGSVAYSPDDVGKGRRSLYFEGGPTFAVSKATKIVVTLARREQAGNPDYTAFSAGISTVVLNGLTIEARYHGTTQAGLGEAYRGRTVVSARLTY